eukprot:gene38787-52392_t
MERGLPPRERHRLCSVLLRAHPDTAPAARRRSVSRKATVAAQGTVPRIMLIRHAEKPAVHEQGVDRHGHPNDGGLSVTGWQRAAALLRLFAPRDDAEASPKLAVALGLSIDERFSTDDPLRRVAALLRSLHEPVLVCWRHDSLPALTNELLQREEAPASWPEHRFDLVWVVDTTGAGSFHQVPQKLLPQDGSQAVAKRGTPIAASVFMRIAYISETYPPEINGVSLTVARTLTTLRERGHRVLLVRPRQPGESSRDDDHEWRSFGRPIPVYPDLRFGLALPASLRARLERSRAELVHLA